jgi:mycothiol synthase
LDDAAGIAAAINALSRSLYGEDEITTAELRSWFDVPSMEMLVARLPGGEIAGYADMTVQAEQTRFWIDLRVAPSSNDAAIGDALVGELEFRAREVAAPGAVVRMFVASTDALALRLVQQRSYEVFRHSFQMRIDFDGELADPVWPEGIAVRSYVLGTDDRVVYDAQQESFADGFEFAPRSFEEWCQWAFREPFDPSLCLLAVDGAEIAGVCLCRPEAGGEGELGWIESLGVRSPWRRRGLGRALLLYAFAEFRARGKVGVGLNVDGLNPTGAVQLYECAGMRVARRADQYEKPLST